MAESKTRSKTADDQADGAAPAEPITWDQVVEICGRPDIHIDATEAFRLIVHGKTSEMRELIEMAEAQAIIDQRQLPATSRDQLYERFKGRENAVVQTFRQSVRAAFNLGRNGYTEEGEGMLIGCVRSFWEQLGHQTLPMAALANTTGVIDPRRFEQAAPPPGPLGTDPTRPEQAMGLTPDGRRRDGRDHEPLPPALRMARER